MRVVRVLYFGRLTKEKGFDHVINLLTKLKSNGMLKEYAFYIFGQGDLENDLLKLGVNRLNYDGNIEKYMSGGVYYFGRGKFDTITEFSKYSDFSLMPSLFLETFGLTALESLNLRLPVIGPKKGGLDQFIFDEFNLLNYSGEDYSSKLFDLFSNKLLTISQIQINKYKQDSFDISLKYNINDWLVNFKNKFPNKKILMVSDYLPKIGGIESYILKVSELLNQNGYEVSSFGLKGINNSIPRRIKVMGLPIAGFNLYYGVKFLVALLRDKPDLIRFHSVGRFLGWFVLFCSSFFKVKKIVMYHDFGYLHPFPSMVYEESDLNYVFSYSGFIKAAKVNGIKRIAVVLKFFSSYLIWKMFVRIIDWHLVPSSFMKQIIINNYLISSEKVLVMNHFI